MAAASDYLEAEIAELIFGISAFSAPANVYIGLFTAAPSDSGGGTEVTGGSYARAAVTNDATKWDLIAGNIENQDAITYATATANWGTVTHFGIFDAASGGNLLWHGALTSSSTVNNGGTYRIAVGDISITFATGVSNYLRDSILNHCFGIAAWTVPATLYTRLYTSNPTAAGGGTQVSGSGTAYAPEAVTNNGTSWARTVNEVDNSNAIQFDEATASWGTVTAAALWDSASAGNLILWNALTSPQTVNNGDTFGFDPATFVVRVN